MKVLYAVIFLAFATTAIEINFCPKIQEVDWEIERLLPHRECNKFYQCTHGEPVEMSCPKGLVFSIIERKCDWRDNVDCGERIDTDELNIEAIEENKLVVNTSVTDSENNSTSDKKDPVNPENLVNEFFSNGCPVDSEIHWLLPHETFCNLFYYCVWGVKELSRCPFWLHFNKKLQVCDWPRRAGCIE